MKEKQPEKLGSWACRDLESAVPVDDDVKEYHCVADDNASCKKCVPSKYVLKKISYAKQKAGNDNSPEVVTPVYVPTSCTCVDRETLNHVVENKRCGTEYYNVKGMC